jgi:hypothetical protein
VSEPGGTPVGVGTLVGARYRLEERIGGGAMGTVWTATDERLKRVVAVKQVLTPPGATAEQVVEQRELALREGRIAARVNNVHAIAVYDVAVDAGEPWLVMEHLPSSDLAAVIAAEMVLPVTQAAQIGAQVADAMVDVHAAGILHRDIKPANVLVGEGGDGDGIVKLTDFGIAHADGDPRLTDDGTLTGTPAYFAPEVARGAPSTTASDVFSLGATLFACLEGAPPFGRDDDHYVMLRRVAAGVTDPMTRAGAAEPLLARMLAPDPADRPTMAQVRDELAGLAAGRPDAVPEVLAARTRLVPLSHVAAGLGAAAAVGAAVGAASSVGSASSTIAAAGADAAVVGGADAAVVGGADAAVVGGADAVAAPAAAAAAAPEVAPAGAATTALTTTTAAKAGGFAVLLSKPVLIAASVGAVVLAGGGAVAVLSGSSGTAPSAAAPTSSTQPAPTSSVVTTPAGAEQAVRALLARLPTDPAGALTSAGPSLQGVGPATVAAYFQKGTSWEVVNLSVQDGGTVTTELLTTLRDGSTTTRQVVFTVTATAAPTAGAATGTVSTPPSPTPGTASVRPGQSPPAGTPTPAALVVDSAQLAALLTAGPPTTAPPSSSTAAPPATGAATGTAPGSASPSPAITPTTIPSAAPAPSTQTATTTPAATTQP